VTTETLKEADRYLMNNGFSCRKEVDLGGAYESSYTFGNLSAKAPQGIDITLHDYGDGHWTLKVVGHSEDLTAKTRQITEALRGLPGFEPHGI
jgi:hypothetical protein